jgi:hypothetical protein
VTPLVLIIGGAILLAIMGAILIWALMAISRD